ncbi:MAG: PIN domain-containing protein [Candidatus Saccharibacteria bacterium]|nr:PIN domain-containing protein [Candidatus Saccharibacteria bacterium]
MAFEDKIQSVDTNVLLRIILRDNEKYYRRALDLVMNGTDYYVDDYVIGECEHVLGREGYGREGIKGAIETLLGNRMFVWNSEFFEKVFENYLKHPKLSFNDCYLAEKAKGLGREPLWTFDKRLVTQLGAKIPS